MMKKLKKKLHSRAGESITETLIALLIAALALTMLAGAMMTASGLVTRSKEKLEGENGYYANSEKLVKMESGTDGTITIKGSGLNDQTISIKYEKNTTFGNTPVVAYKKN